MAYLSASSNGSGSITWTVGGLQQSISLYSFSLSTSDGKVGNGFSGASTTSSGHACGRTITGTVYITFKGTSQGSVSASTYTYDCPTPPSGTPSVSCSASYSGGHRIYVSWTSVSGATSYTVYANGGSGDHYKGSTSGTSMNIDVDREYTNYTIKVIPSNAYGNGGTGYGYVRTLDVTAPTIGTPYSIEVNVKWFKVGVSAYDSGSGVNYVQFFLYDSNRSEITSTIAYASGGSFETTFTGLTPERVYYVRAKSVDVSGNSSSLSSFSAAIKTLSDRPAPFSWAVTIGSGYNVSNLTASEWNRFTTEINKVRAFKKISGYPFTTVYQGNIMRASYFNEAIYAISSMSPTTGLPSTKSAGNTVVASDFHLLVAALNSIK